MTVETTERQARNCGLTGRCRAGAAYRTATWSLIRS